MGAVQRLRLISGFALVMAFISVSLWGAIEVPIRDPRIFIGFSTLIILSGTLCLDVLRRPLQPIRVQHAFFALTFLSLAPTVMHYSVRWRYTVPTDALLLMQFIGIIWIIAFEIGYWRFDIGRRNTESFFDVNPGEKTLIILLGIALVIDGLLIALLGADAFITRKLRDQALAQFPSSLALVLMRVIRPVSILALITAIVLVYRQQRNHRWYLLISAVAIPTMYVHSPTGSARFWTFSLVFGAILLVSRNWIKNNYPLLLALGTGLFISPIFNIFRHIVSISGITQEATLPSLTNYIGSAHFDAFENGIHTIQYVQQEGITWGWQLLGSLLFFVPRSMWSGKPVATGHFIYTWLETQGYTVFNKNVAVISAAEGFINFHVPGVIVLAVVIGIISGWLDRRYQTANSNEGIDVFPALFAPAFGVFLLLFRGSLLSPVAYLMMYSGSAVCLLLILKFGTVIHTGNLNWLTRGIPMTEKDLRDTREKMIIVYGNSSFGRTITKLKEAWGNSLTKRVLVGE